MYQEQLSQALSLGAAVNPASVAVGTADSGGIDLQKFKRATFVIAVGSVGAAGTVDAKLQESTDGVTFTDLAGTNVSITQITASNKQATLEVRSDQITKRYVRCRSTVGVNAVLLCVVAIGGEANNKPGNKNDDASVAQRQVVS
jgi:hypothetical protein